MRVLPNCLIMASFWLHGRHCCYHIWNLTMDTAFVGYRVSSMDWNFTDVTAGATHMLVTPRPRVLTSYILSDLRGVSYASRTRGMEFRSTRPTSQQDSLQLRSQAITAQSSSSVMADHLACTRAVRVCQVLPTALGLG
ncbi:hypothetical protein F5X99DRAFT_381857 [Biscogniauxia marginata]|nr:hypothetical protein F5X99DRAFT_381857 [Biscogniauxia marginata]